MQHLLSLRFPSSLIIQMKRFGQQGRKDSRSVEVPLVWTPPGNAAPTYYLRAAVIHHGETIGEGHYTCIRIKADGGAVLV